MKEKQHICKYGTNKQFNETLLFKFIICFKP